MKRNRIHTVKKLAAISLLFALVLSDMTIVMADNEKTQSKETEPEETDTANLIEISTAEDLLLLAKNCSLDAFSIGKRVELKNDINMQDIEFHGIPYFNGIFDGNGYKIFNLSLNENGSEYGMFRYVGDLGIVTDLQLAGAVVMTGSQQEIGAIAGVNYGLIQNCTFTGTVYGTESVGAIAGYNTSSGQIIGCRSNAVVLAKDNTGGIVGVNAGIIDNCISESAINNEEFESTLDVGMIDIGSLNFTQTVVDRNNMGGIAGSSTGVIKDCVNMGTVGYAHTGYNVGGIAGSQSGVIIECTNKGTVYGRKDVGGIVGQAEPYVESEYLSEQLEQTKDDIDRINRTLNNMSANLEKNADEAHEYADALTAQLEGTSGSLSDRLDQMGDAVPDDNEEAQQCMDNISAAMDKIEEIQNKNGALTKSDIEEIQRQMDIIEENTKRLEEINKQERDNSDNTIENDTDTSNLRGLSDSIQKSVDTLTNGINSVTSQTEKMMDNIHDSTAVIRGEKSFIVDISSIKTAAELDGVISGCVNTGTVDADLNAGGIAGTMNLEYGDDPEADLSREDSYNIVTSSEVNDVILNCRNYGKVNCKKNCSGSVVGLQTFGYIYQCEGYGHVNSSTGSYAGGIAGMSSGTIEKSYAMLDICAKDYVGGITGEGNTILNCIGIATIEADGERIGGIAGYTEKDGEVSGNLFVKEGYDGIDNISYLGVAEPVSYAEIMEKEGMPEGFTQMQVAFEVEEELVDEMTVPYGSTLTEEDFPKLEEREGYYIKWPKTSVYTNICNNLTIEAEYVPWTQSIVTKTEYEGAVGKPIFIAVGEFYENTTLELTSENTGYVAGEGEQVLYSFDWRIRSEREKVIETIEGHFYVPDSVSGETGVMIQDGDIWKAVDVETDGSYITAEIPYGASFAVIEKPVDMTNIYIAAGAGIFLLLLVIIFIIVHNRHKKQKKDDKR